MQRIACILSLLILFACENSLEPMPFSDDSGIAFTLDNGDMVRIGEHFSFIGNNKSEAVFSMKKEIENPSISYIFDDTYISHYEKVAPLFDQYNMKAGFALVIRQIDVAGRLSTKQALDLQSRGFEIVNHSKTHKNLTYDDVDLVVAEVEILESKDDLENIGLSIKTFVAPYSYTNDKYMHLVRENYDSAYTAYNSTALKNALWKKPRDIKKLPRISTETAIDKIKATIDVLVEKGGFLTFYDHDIDGGKTSLDKVDAIIQYAVNQGVVFNTPNESARKYNINEKSWCDLSSDYSNEYTCRISHDIGVSSSLKKVTFDNLVNDVYGWVSIDNELVTVDRDNCSYEGILIDQGNYIYQSELNGPCGSTEFYAASYKGIFYSMSVFDDDVLYQVVD